MARSRKTTPYHSILITGNGWAINAVVKHAVLEESKALARLLWQSKEEAKAMRITNEKFEVIFKHRN